MFEERDIKWLWIILIIVGIIVIVSAMTQAQDITGWMHNKTEDEMDGEVTHILMKLSEDSLENIEMRHEWVALFLTFDAEGNAKDVGLVHNGFVDGGDVRYKFDDGDIVESEWMYNEKMILKAMNNSEMKQFLTECKSSSVFKIEYDTYNDGMVVKKFGLEGIGEKLEVIGW